MDNEQLGSFKVLVKGLNGTLSKKILLLHSSRLFGVLLCYSKWMAQIALKNS